MAQLPTRPLGDSGLAVTVVGLGCNNFGRRLDLGGTRAVIDEALAQGINFFDTADIYARGQSEEFIGELLNGRRDEVLLATKFGMDMGDGKGPRGSRGYILDAIDASLKRLRTDAVDYYWYHEPDGVTPISETLETLDELVKAGKVRAIGASNFSAAQLFEADEVARERGLARFTAVQNEYNLLVRDAESDVLPACEQLQIGFVPFYPLASGLLTGKYRSGEPGPVGARLSGRDQVATSQQFELIDSLRRFADERDLTLTEVAIGALLAHPPVSSVIAGATKAEQVRANVGAARWTPDGDDLDALGQLLAAAPA
jgi:aryl-alcohol dehydrogenase-like predicted oxidoreductase